MKGLWLERRVRCGFATVLEDDDDDEGEKLAVRGLMMGIPGCEL